MTEPFSPPGCVHRMCGGTLVQHALAGQGFDVERLVQVKPRRDKRPWKGAIECEKCGRLWVTLDVEEAP